jgi:adenylate cyclase
MADNTATTIPLPIAGQFSPGGQRREVTVAFADIRSFTTLADCLVPEELVSVLNRYLAVVIKSFLQGRGMIHKLMGDSVMAVWNAPQDLADHALLATRAATEAQQAIRELRREEFTLPKMDFGIGINTGNVITGHFGGEDCQEYSVIGDTVNIAARLTGAAPGGKVWITGSTFEQIEAQVSARPLTLMALKGKRQLVKAYEVTEIRGSTPETKTRLSRSGEGEKL